MLWLNKVYTSSHPKMNLTKGGEHETRLSWISI